MVCVEEVGLGSSSRVVGNWIDEIIGGCGCKKQGE